MKEVNILRKRCRRRILNILTFSPLPKFIAMLKSLQSLCIKIITFEKYFSRRMFLFFILTVFSRPLINMFVRYSLFETSVRSGASLVGEFDLRKPSFLSRLNVIILRTVWRDVSFSVVICLAYGCTINDIATEHFYSAEQSLFLQFKLNRSVRHGVHFPSS